jgi:imidazolonepropionase-like amidohydrolase
MKVIQDYLLVKGVKESSMTLFQMLLKWATYNGAKYLCVDKTMGSIEVGKKPGLCVIENLAPNYAISNDTYIRRLI